MSEKPQLDSQTFLAKGSLIWDKYFSTALVFLLSGLFFLSFVPQTTDYLLPVLYCACGTPALLSSIQEIQARSFSMDTLMALAGFLAPLIGRGREGIFLLLLFFLSKELEKKIIHKATDAARLAQLHAPQRVWESREGELRPTHIRDVNVDMHIAVHAGEIIPLDGIVLSGRSEVTTTQLNGELEPTAIGPGDLVYSGSYNQQALLLIRVTKKATESTLERLIHLITEAKSEVPFFQLILTQNQNRYALFVVALCFFVLISFPYLLIDGSFSGPGGSFERSLTLLIALSPCALLIAVPSCYLSAISCCTRKGILVKGTRQLELIPSINTVAFDKTGTLTESLLRLDSIFIWNKKGEKSEPPREAFQALLCLEEQSLHPIGQSIAFALRKRLDSSMNPSDLDQMEQIPGQGVVACLDGSILCIGGRRLAAQWAPPNVIEIAEKESKRWSQEGGTTTYGWTHDHLFLFCLEEKIRESASQVIQFLKENNINSIILSGDSQEQVERVAQHLDIQSVYFDLTPRQKFDLISELAQKKQIMMIGDGVNDSPALAKAHLGVAMGGFGNSLATESASIVLLDNNLAHIPWLFIQAQKTQNVVLEGWLMSGLSILLGAFLALSGHSMIWLSVLLHEGSTLLVALNGLRLL